MRDEKIAGTALLNELYINGWVVYMTLAKEVPTRVLKCRVSFIMALCKYLFLLLDYYLLWSLK
jgi:hypothetical protein